MYSIEETYNFKELLRPYYDELVYDGSPQFEEFKPTGIWFVLYDNERPAGLINLNFLNNVMWNAHVIVFKEFRGPGSEEWGKLVAQYMRNKYGAKKFLAITPYEAAKKYAERMGFKLVATLEKSILKNGQLLDQYLLESN